VPIALQKPVKPKVDAKQKALNDKLESGFGNLSINAEEKQKAAQREKQAEAKKRMDEIKEQKALKAKEEMEKLKKINQGATEYMKQQKKELEKGKLN